MSLECVCVCLTNDLDGGRGVDAATLVASGAGVQSCVLLSNPLDAERAVGVVQLHACRETQGQLDSHIHTHTHTNKLILTSALISTLKFVTSVGFLLFITL